MIVAVCGIAGAIVKHPQLLQVFLLGIALLFVLGLIVLVLDIIFISIYGVVMSFILLIFYVS